MSCNQFHSVFEIPQLSCRNLRFPVTDKIKFLENIWQYYSLKLHFVDVCLRVCLRVCACLTFLLSNGDHEITVIAVHQTILVFLLNIPCLSY